MKRDREKYLANNVHTVNSTYLYGMQLRMMFPFYFTHFKTV